MRISNFIVFHFFSLSLSHLPNALSSGGSSRVAATAATTPRCGIAAAPAHGHETDQSGPRCSGGPSVGVGHGRVFGCPVFPDFAQRLPATTSTGVAFVHPHFGVVVLFAATSPRRPLSARQATRRCCFSPVGTSARRRRRRIRSSFGPGAGGASSGRFFRRGGRRFGGRRRVGGGWWRRLHHRRRSPDRQNLDYEIVGRGATRRENGGRVGAGFATPGGLRRRKLRRRDLIRRHRSESGVASPSARAASYGSAAARRRIRSALGVAREIGKRRRRDSFGVVWVGAAATVLSRRRGGFAPRRRRRGERRNAGFRGRSA